MGTYVASRGIVVRLSLTTTLFIGATLAFPCLATAESRQFDLDCTGTGAYGTDTPSPRTDHIRVDLDANQWCMNACKDVSPIRSVTASTIQFMSIEADRVYDATVDRQTGVFVWKSRLAAVRVRVDETCKVAPFTPFPKTMF